MQEILFDFSDLSSISDRDLRARIHNLGVARDALRSITARCFTPKAQAHFQRRLETCETDLTSAHKEARRRRLAQEKANNDKTL